MRSAARLPHGSQGLRRTPAPSRGAAQRRPRSPHYPRCSRLGSRPCAPRAGTRMPAAAALLAEPSLPTSGRAETGADARVCPQGTSRHPGGALAGRGPGRSKTEGWGKEPGGRSRPRDFRRGRTTAARGRTGACGRERSGAGTVAVRTADAGASLQQRSVPPGGRAPGRAAMDPRLGAGPGVQGFGARRGSAGPDHALVEDFGVLFIMDFGSLKHRLAGHCGAPLGAALAPPGGPGGFPAT